MVLMFTQLFNGPRLEEWRGAGCNISPVRGARRCTLNAFRLKKEDDLQLVERCLVKSSHSSGWNLKRQTEICFMSDGA